MADLTFSIELLRDTYPEFEPLYRMHYGEMKDRLAGQGVEIGEYAPDLDRYFAANDCGMLIHFTVRVDDMPVGYSNVYLTADMHNGEPIATEDTVYIRPEFRSGIGRKFILWILDDLRRRGVKRANVSATTDTRVAKLLGRIGFREVATQMAFIFEGN